MLLLPHVKRSQDEQAPLPTDAGIHSSLTFRPPAPALFQPQYVSEVVGALCEAPLRLKDVPAALAVCSALHQRYADFAKELVTTLAKLAAAAGGQGTQLK